MDYSKENQERMHKLLLELSETYKAYVPEVQEYLLHWMLLDLSDNADEKIKDGFDYWEGGENDG